MGCRNSKSIHVSTRAKNALSSIIIMYLSKNSISKCKFGSDEKCSILFHCYVSTLNEYFCKIWQESTCISFFHAEKDEVKWRCCCRWWWELIYLLLVLLRSKTWHLLQLHLTSSFPWLRVSTSRYNTTNNRLEAKIMRHVFLYNRCRYSHEKTFYHSPHGKHLLR